MAGPPLALLRTLGFVWMLPATLVGLVLGALALGLGRASWRSGVLWVPATRGLAVPIARRSYPAATTFGAVVLLWHPDRLSDALEAHELVHVAQYRLLGVFFFPLYLALAAVFGSRERHPLEKPAYERGRQVREGGG